jgi:hypothetical protein
VATAAVRDDKTFATHDEGGEKAIDLLNVHGFAVVADLQELPKVFKFRFRQRIAPAKDFHRHR